MPKLTALRNLFACMVASLWCSSTQAQQNNHLQYVDPFIGTTKSNVLTKWGNNGGTYPGAVAPAGALQLSPETRISGAKGYDYTDSVIYYFSCFGHMSGFPEGSAGRLLIMPVAGKYDFEAGNYSRRFAHQHETASAGYYKVTFKDDGTTVEATATPRTGLFRFTFGKGDTPRLFIGDMGDIITLENTVIRALNHNTVLNLSEAFADKKQIKGGWLLTFKPAVDAGKVIVLKMSTSSIGFKESQNNIDQEIGNAAFDAIRKRTQDSWLKALAVIDVTDADISHKTSFYTALYHSLLIPWVIDDADGRYQGADGQIHQKSGNNQYGAFSPWDTFRSLHPLLTLLYPEKQQDVILSMLDIYKQTGHLPTESMTGNHAVPIIVDSYLKGLHGFDKQQAYKAMKKSVLEPPFIQSDMEVFNQTGYVPFTRSESVTRTVEYAYDVWALAQYAESIGGQSADYGRLSKMGYNYRNLFNNEALLMLPRNGSQWKTEPGMSGYKEGNKWVYSYFVPQNVQDLINLNGGEHAFASRLDSALTHNVILFDNETVFHLPYLFNQAGYPALTQKWCRQIMLNRFSATPGGLPGNDDLGSTSSWFVFSAIGLYPVCPGRPYYSIGAPIFQTVTLHLPNKKNLVINSSDVAAESYVQALKVNGQPWQQLVLPHSVLMDGGSIDFTMSSHAGNWPVDKKPVLLSETKGRPGIKLLNYKVGVKMAAPNQLFTVRFAMQNNGRTGTKKITLFVNGKAYAYKHCLLEAGQKLTDSIQIRLFAVGSAQLRLEQMPPVSVTVKQSQANTAAHLISDLTVSPMVKQHDSQQVSYVVQNIGGFEHTFEILLKSNNSVLAKDKITLLPGEKKQINHSFMVTGIGFQQMKVDNAVVRFKVYKDPVSSVVLDLPLVDKPESGIIKDKSGFNNNGALLPVSSDLNLTKSPLLFGENSYVEVANSHGLDLFGQTITMMAWVKPEGREQGLVDVFSKGDSHVLQVTDSKTLTFFAGGWGRGDCTVQLPANWRDTWHHIAGVCNGKSLFVYIDGVLKGTTETDEIANLFNTNRWTLGRNEEFPSERIYHGYINKAMVFKEALSATDISTLHQSQLEAFGR